MRLKGYSCLEVHSPKPISGKKLIAFAIMKYAGKGLVTEIIPKMLMVEITQQIRITKGTIGHDR